MSDENVVIKMYGTLKCKSNIMTGTNYYFTLESGELSYFESEHHIFKGKYLLLNVNILSRKNKSAEEKRTIRLAFPNGVHQSFLVLVAKTSRKRHQWVSALQENIDYANFCQLYSILKESDSHKLGTNEDMIYYEGNPEEEINVENMEDDVSENESECEDVDEKDLPTNAIVECSKQTFSKPSRIKSTETKSSRSTRSITPPRPTKPCQAELLPAAIVRDRITGAEVCFQYVSQYAVSLLEVDSKLNGSIGAEPPICTGWLKKRGDVFKTLRRRFFVLEKGWIKWFLDEPTSSPALKPKGELNLHDYQMYSDSPAGKIRLVLDPGYDSKVKRRLLLYCENYQEKTMWTRAINQHISFRLV